MFTEGQWVVAILFVIVFSVLMIYSYSKDMLLHKRYYKGSIWVLFGFVVFIILLFAIKFFMNS